MASYTLVQQYPHTETCFTEGLITNGTADNPVVFESCGLYGRSSLRAYFLNSGMNLAMGYLPEEIFSEGITLMGNSLFMITYKEGVIVEYDATTNFDEIRKHSFPYGEGWGLTNDGCDLLATTGEPYIYRLRLSVSGSLDMVGSVWVNEAGYPVRDLNEIEYIAPKIWINQWHTSILLRVDPATGNIDRKLDMGGLFYWEGEMTPNGIAYHPALGMTSMMVTGKRWTAMFLLNLTQADLCGESINYTQQQLGCKTTPTSACWLPRPPPLNTTNTTNTTNRTAVANHTAAANRTAGANHTAAANTTAGANHSAAANTTARSSSASAAAAAARAMRGAGEGAAAPHPVRLDLVVQRPPAPVMLTPVSTWAAAGLALIAVWLPLGLWRRSRAEFVVDEGALLEDIN